MSLFSSLFNGRNPNLTIDDIEFHESAVIEDEESSFRDTEVRGPQPHINFSNVSGNNDTENSAHMANLADESESSAHMAESSDLGFESDANLPERSLENKIKKRILKELRILGKELPDGDKDPLIAAIAAQSRGSRLIQQICEDDYDAFGASGSKRRTRVQNFGDRLKRTYREKGAAGVHRIERKIDGNIANSNALSPSQTNPRARTNTAARTNTPARTNNPARTQTVSFGPAPTTASVAASRMFQNAKLGNSHNLVTGNGPDQQVLANNQPSWENDELETHYFCTGTKYKRCGDFMVIPFQVEPVKTSSAGSMLKIVDGVSIHLPRVLHSEMELCKAFLKDPNTIVIQVPVQRQQDFKSTIDYYDTTFHDQGGNSKMLAFALKKCNQQGVFDQLIMKTFVFRLDIQVTKEYFNEGTRGAELALARTPTPYQQNFTIPADPDNGYYESKRAEVVTMSSLMCRVALANSTRSVEEIESAEKKLAALYVGNLHEIYQNVRGGT